MHAALPQVRCRHHRPQCRLDRTSRIGEEVGDAGERFREDALRLMRAVRFHAQLGFAIEKKTLAALKAESQLLEHIANIFMRLRYIALDGIVEMPVIDALLAPLFQNVGISSGNFLTTVRV